MVVVGAFLLANLVVVGVGFYEIATNPQFLADWQDRLFTRSGGNPLVLLGVSLLVFPQLALGLSGFETGVGRMPLVRGKPGDDPERPAGRIHNTRKMLAIAAVIMSFYLLTTSIVTAVLIPASEFGPGGAANGRALTFLAHENLGDVFGTIYDISTITILFAGASALEVKEVRVGEYKVLRVVSSTVPNAALLLHLRDTTGKKPHCYFGWTEGNLVVYLIRYLLFGEGDTAPVTREVLREAEKDPERRPSIHVGG